MCPEGDGGRRSGLRTLSFPFSSIDICFFPYRSALQFVLSFNLTFNHAYIDSPFPGSAAIARAHVATFVDGMYYKDGNVSTIDDSNTNTIINLLYTLTQDERGSNTIGAATLFHLRKESFSNCQQEDPSRSSWHITVHKQLSRTMDSTHPNGQMETLTLRTGEGEA